MVATIILNTLLFLSSLSCQSPEFIVLEHIGEQDKPVKGIIIIESEESYVKSEGFFVEHGISTTDFQIIKWFILHEDLNKNRKCNEFGGEYGTFSIQLYDEKTCRCFLIDKAEQSVDFFHGLFIKTMFHEMDQKLQDSLESVIVQLIGVDAYKKRYNPLYQNDTLNKALRSSGI